ncbi:right-handed parallel beta-helix repeat-containing protein [Flavitalea antarctica]
MKTFHLFICLISATLFASAQTQWHVSGKGNDDNDGKSSSKAFRTLKKAAALVQPGDAVLVYDGDYADNDKGNGSAVVTLSASGTEQAWITWKAAPGAKPVVRPAGWAGILITGSYNILDGITVTGANDSLVLSAAQAEAKNKTPDPKYNTNGIFFNGRNRKADEKPHHLVIRNCTVNNCPGGGITGIEIDYLTVEDCKVYNNAWFMRYGGSGITTLNNWAYDDAPGYHIIIQRNRVWYNKTLVPWEQIGKLSDGNGILLDVTDQARNGATNPNADAAVKVTADKPKTDTAKATADSTPPRPRRPEWKGRALIANNISAFNGGSGIHTFRTRHVDIINNTTYHNGAIVGYQELFPNNSEDIVILNNIIVPRPGGKVTSNNKNTNIRWDYNLYPQAQNVIKGEHDIVAEPLFLGVGCDMHTADFRMAKGSNGLNSATPELAQPTDINGKARPKTTGRDRGAYEQ